jgi:histidinol-phosphate aminotransferase
VHKALLTLVSDIPDSQSNFVWLPLRDRAGEFAAACERRGVIVRAFQGEGVRVTIGTPEENDAFLTVAEAALNS